MPNEPSGAVVPNKKSSPIATFAQIMGVLCLLFWIAIILDEIQTSEAGMGAHLHATLVPNWLILWQPVQLITGDLSPDAVAPVVIGWIVELFVLIYTFVYEISIVRAKKHNLHLSKIFKTICLAALAYDGWSNYVSGFAHGDFIHQAAFVVGMAAGAVLLPIGALACFHWAQSEA